jgi:hypothetical protein
VNLEDYKDADDFLDDALEDESNYDPSDEECDDLDELLDEPLVVA